MFENTKQILAISASARRNSTNERIQEKAFVELFEGVETPPHIVPGDED